MKLMGSKLRFLFWNLGGRSLSDRVARLARRNDVDVVILAEARGQGAELLLALNAERTDYQLTSDSNSPRITILTHFDTSFLKTLFDGNRFTIRRLTLPGRREILLAAVHLLSLLRADDVDQGEEASEVTRALLEVEAKAGLPSVVVGDFNMSPFDDGIVKAAGFHAMMTRDIARRGGRTVQGREYGYFYNPMWGLYGDREASPPATFFRKPSGSHVEHMWHMYDQVLLRPALLDHFDNDDLAILNHDGASPLVTERGIPDARNASDHLPILFSLSL